MDQTALKRFVEQVYCVEYNPAHVIPMFSKNTNDKIYFTYKPFKSGFLETEFYYDVKLKRLIRLNNVVDWDPMMNDTFS